MKKLLFRSDGTVTLFCALIMMGLTVFLMVLLDYARILLFQRTTESALKLSAQSVISAYDRELYQQYGLFGRGGSPSEKLFKEAMELNLLNSFSVFSVDQGSDFVQPKLEQVEIYEGDYLGQHQIFERQVLEEMKYRAPIDFTLELLEQWLPITDAVTQGEGIIKVIEELEKLYVEREEKLERILQLQQQLGKLIHASSFRSTITTSVPSTLNSYSNYLSWLEHEDNLTVQIVELYEQLASMPAPEPVKEEGEIGVPDGYSQLLEQITRLEKQRDKYSSQISSYTSTAAKIVSTLQTEGNKLLEKNVELSDELNSLLREARTLDQTINNKYRLYLKNENEADAGAGAGADKESSSELQKELNKLNFDESMIRGESYFNSYQEAIQLQTSTLDSIANDGISLASEINGLVNKPQLYNASHTNDVKNAAAKLKQEIETYDLDYRNPATLLVKWEQELHEQREVQDQLEQYEDQFEEASLGYNDIIKLLTEIEDIQNAGAAYDDVQQRYELNYDRNLNLGDEDKLDRMNLTGNGKKQAGSAASMLTKILHTLSNSGQSIRDNVYVNEYALSKFSSFPMGDLFADGDPSADLLELSQQEIEYILYGVDEPLTNVVIACGYIFAVRLAIRTIEGFISNRGLSHPLLILGAAVVHGVKEAISDMKQLLNEGNTELSRYAPIEISYPQYLRLFFLLSMNKSAKLSRMIALIEQNLDVTLFQVPTSITVQSQFSMRLWSLPGLAQLTGGSMLMDSGVSGNVYSRSELVTASY